MIRILSVCEEIKRLLELRKEEGIIKDFRVCLRKNENLYVDIVLSDDTDGNDELTDAIKAIYRDAEVEYLTKEQKEDPFYKSIFSSHSLIILSNGHRRNGNLKSKKEKTMGTSMPPVASFYSYKGGMGRTTTMVAYALYLSSVCHQKVVLIDCDLEAPGLNNFFLKYPAEQNNHNGLVEYLLDRGTNLVGPNMVTDYMQEVDHIFSGDGSIYVMPAGNMSDRKAGEGLESTHFDHFIEGVSRIDINNSSYAKGVFQTLVNDIAEAVHPDVICIDSKTGINDVMGVSVCALADVVVGFFRNDAQSLPGLQFFIRTMMDNTNVEPFLVNAILPSAVSQRRMLFRHFQDDVDEITTAIDDDSNINFPCFPISRQADFETLGSVAEAIGDFKEVIQRGDFREYSDLFIALTKSVQGHKKSEERGNGADKAKLRDEILASVSETLDGIDLYAENQSIALDMDSRHFYYRRCMNDLLNHDKYLVIGSKGTGKSYIYQALKDSRALQLIKTNAGKTDDCHFLYAVDRTRNRIFDVTKMAEPDAAGKYKFWLIYTWNIIIADIRSEFPDYQISDGLRQLEISDTITSREQLELVMADDDYVKAIEREFVRIDDYLKARPTPTYLDIIFDQLDEMVQPSVWNNWIPDLIRIWRVKRYSRVGAKLFVRRDLFRGLVGLTNINDIENQAIDIEWHMEEIYSYFFYVILKGETENKFWQLMKMYGAYSEEEIKGFASGYNEKVVPLYDNQMLEAMMGTFFGENVDVGGTTRMGRSYEWFYKNLKNADGTISLRPFISLLKLSVKKQIEENIVPEGVDYPILYQACYTNSKVRKEAVKDYLDDLIRNANGNLPIQYVFEYISNTQNMRYHRISMRRAVFEELLGKVIEVNQGKVGMESITLEKLANILVDNGIVAIQNRGNMDFYTFSFLYKYRLGLHGS